MDILHHQMNATVRSSLRSHAYIRCIPPAPSTNTEVARLEWPCHSCHLDAESPSPSKNCAILCLPPHQHSRALDHLQPNSTTSVVRLILPTILPQPRLRTNYRVLPPQWLPPLEETIALSMPWQRLLVLYCPRMY